LTAGTGGFHGAGASLVRLAKHLTEDRSATMSALEAGRISRVQAEVVLRSIDVLPKKPDLRDRAEVLLLA
jgi:hypothetical protein